MSTGIDIRNKEGVLRQLDTFDTPFFTVHCGKDLKFYHDDDNFDSAKQILSDNLDLLEANGTAATFKISFYTGLNSAGKFVPENLKGSNTFRLTPNLSEFARVNMGGAPIPGYNVRSADVERLERENELLREQLQALQEDDQDDDDDDDTPQSVGAVIGAVFTNMLAQPQVQQALITGAIKFFDKIMNTNNTGANNGAGSAQIAGASAGDVQASFNELMKHITPQDLAKLAALPTNNAALFNILITQLRAM